MNEYVGTVCRCKHGKLGLVLDFSVYKKSYNNEDWVVYTGINLEQGGQWQSQYPEVVFNSLQEYISSVKNKRADMKIVDGVTYLNNDKVIPLKEENNGKT